MIHCSVRNPKFKLVHLNLEMDEDDYITVITGYETLTLDVKIKKKEGSEHRDVAF